MPSRPATPGPGLSRTLALALTLCAVASLATPSPAAKPKERASGTTHALLINGGSKPSANYLSHLNHLQDLVELLRQRDLPLDRIHIFSADGEDAAADLAVRTTRPDGFWLIEGTDLGRKLRPRTKLTNTEWAGVTLNPARRDALRKWFESGAERLQDGDRLLIFVTDHGEGNEEDPDNGSISLWKEELPVNELREMLSELRPGVQVVMVMSQCYSGTFANAMYEEDSGRPRGNLCGFFSTLRDLRAYGCYPEGRDRDRIGHAFRFIDALGAHGSMADAHRQVLITDSTPDVPVRTTDVYLARLVEEEAGALGIEADELADRLLADAWRDRAAWEPEIRLLDRIGDAFGTFSPRTLAELGAYERELPALTERMKTYAERWKQAWIDVKQENLSGFKAAETSWSARLDNESLQKLSADGRKELLGELLPALQRHSRSNAGTWKRLQDLRERTELASEARWRLEVRSATLRRMRSILTGIAGRTLVRSEPGRASRTLARLEQCESFEPGRLPAEREALASESVRERPFPSLEEDFLLAERVLPSWLGVRFRPVPKTLRAERELAEGASFLNAIYPDSPAIDAGLEVGDIVLGADSWRFTTPRQIREWTMVSPRGKPLSLSVLRPGNTVEEDRVFEVSVTLKDFPMKWPELPSPPEIGEAAPSLPSELQPLGEIEWASLADRPRLLFFWATWCEPCKRAVPEVMAFAESRGYAALAISDEDRETVSDFLGKRREPFFDKVAVDVRRKSFLGYGVSGTPTIVVIDGDGVIRERQVGYNPRRGLAFEGWSWSPAGQGQGEAESRSSRGSVPEDESP